MAGWATGLLLTRRTYAATVLTSGVALAAAGVSMGAVGAWFAGRLIEASLYGVEARAVTTLVIAVSVAVRSAGRQLDAGQARVADESAPQT